MANPAAGFAQSASPEVRAAARHLVTLRGYGEGGEVTAQGSGFYFGPGRIATNYHVISGASYVRILGVDGKLLGTAMAAEAIDTRLDLAILPAQEARSDGLWLETFLPDVGDHVWVYGSPKGLGGTMTDGIVSAVRERTGRTMVQISAPISPGSSGGPVLNERGRVIGVTVSSVRGGQNLNFAMPARELARLAATRGELVTFPTGSSPRQTADGGGTDDEGGSGGADAGGAARGDRGRRELPERWEFIARNSSDADLYYDRETMARDDDRLRVWIYTLYPETQTAGAAAFDASQALFEFRCAVREFRLNQYLLLRGEKVIGSNGSVSGGEWSAAAPDSVAEGLLRSVCSPDS